MDPSAFRPHGLAMQAYHRGRTGATIVVTDDLGDTDEFEVEYFFRGPDRFQEYESVAVELARGRVLDVGAGAGCHSLILQDRGLDVVALEIVPELVDVLRERGVRDARCEQISDFEDGTFDTILLLMNGIGLAETLAGVAPLLAHLEPLLNDGGQVLADSTDVREAYGPHTDPAGTLHRADGRYMGEITFQIEFDGEKGPPFPQLYVDFETLVKEAASVGWKVERLLESEQGQYLARLSV